MVISILLLTILWVMSLMSFARWRVLVNYDRGTKKDPADGIVFQIYLKGSGIIILYFIFKLIALN